MFLMIMNTKLKLNHMEILSLSKEYYRTSHTTMERLKEPAKSDPPKTVFFKSIEEKGTILDFRNAASHARNVQQIKNIKKTMEELPGDSTLELIDMLKQGNRDKENAFVRKVETSSDPCVVLTTDQQLKDVERFCTNPSQFSILGVDPIFNFWRLLCDSYYIQASPSPNQRRQESSPDWTNPSSPQKRTIQILRALVYHDKAKCKNPKCSSIWY